jgi:hypothetical protein
VPGLSIKLQRLWNKILSQSGVPFRVRFCFNMPNSVMGPCSLETPKSAQASNIVYFVVCDKCSKEASRFVYIGETSQELSVRMADHLKQSSISPVRTHQAVHEACWFAPFLTVPGVCERKSLEMSLINLFNPL